MRDEIHATDRRAPFARPRDARRPGRAHSPRDRMTRAVQAGADPAVSGAQRLVVILYEHALLGEGIAKYLRAQLGVEVMIASGNDLEAVTSALAPGPAIVIFELSDTLRQLDLAALAPDADLIDVSTVVARGPGVPSKVSCLERILQAVRHRVTVDEPAETSTGQTPAWRPNSQVKHE
jgi:hypothetical protein